MESLCNQYQTQQTQNICITVVQRWPNVFDFGPTLYKCYTNVLCLLGEKTSHNARTISMIIMTASLLQLQWHAIYSKLCSLSFNNTKYYDYYRSVETKRQALRSTHPKHGKHNSTSIPSFHRILIFSRKRRTPDLHTRPAETLA